jgi:hypothetical protein
MLVGFDKDLGRIFLPALARATSAPGARTRRAIEGEFGLVVAKQRRPVVRMREGKGGVLLPELLGFQTIWASVSHNERVDAGANYQAKQVFAGGSSPAAPSATVYFNVIGVASASLTKAKGDQSLGSTSSGVTTNEYTTVGLSRATANSPAGGDYTAPASLGAVFSQVVAKTFTVSGAGGTAYGAGLFNSTTVAGSILYVEENFSSNAVLVSGDTLTVTFTISN